MKEYTEIFTFPDDYEGPVRATLIGFSAERSSRKALLYLHGYVDYFFQTHMAQAFVAGGWDFFAVDLRKYGRSILPHQHPYYCRDLQEYFPDIDRSIDWMTAHGYEQIVLLGHSTGGLIASLYAAAGARRERIEALVLNSPFFEFNAGWFKRRVAIPLVGCIGRLFPYAHKRNELSPHYFASVHRSEKGEWNFDTRWKPKEGVPLYFAWLRAIRRGQRRLHRGLGLTLPVLVLHSARSAGGKVWCTQFTDSDIVLQVDHIRRYALRLGDRVTDVAIEGGLHDLTLSAQPIRQQVFDTILFWLSQHTY